MLQWECREKKGRKTMGLDMTVSFTRNNGQDERGNYQYLETVVGNLRNCWDTLEELDIENCATQGVFISQFIKMLDNEDIPDHEKDYIREVLNELKEYGIEDTDEIVDVHVWY